MTEIKSYKGYEPVIGVEVHVELKTITKAFCSCSAKYGDIPNANVCPICLGMPGTMPSLNQEAIKLAAAAGLALGCELSPVSRFDRKHYYYSDLPKGYQITQYYSPLCRDGLLRYEVGGSEKIARITRIHLEEDAGRLINRNGETFADYNRCGAPLIEIVTAPDMRSSEEAMAFVEELRRTLLFAGISDCKMNEGSLRCDVNISVRPLGEETLGARCEIKNINSINYLGRAIDYELVRQTEEILSGKEISTETRRFSEDDGTTERMRDKETPLDYRYTIEPNLPPIIIDKNYINDILKSMPTLHRERISRYTEKLGLRREDAKLICCSPESAEYFDLAVSQAPMESIKTVASLYIGEVLPLLREKKSVASPKRLSEISSLYVKGRITAAAAKKLLVITSERDVPASELAEELGLTIISDRDEISQYVLEAVEANPKAVADISRGKTQAMKAIVGAVMKITSGRAEPSIVNEEVKKHFDKKIDLGKEK